MAAMTFGMLIQLFDSQSASQVRQSGAYEIFESTVEIRFTHTPFG